MNRVGHNRVKNNALTAQAVMAEAQERLKAGDLDGAIAAIERGLPLVEQPLHLYMLKGLLHQKRGRFEQALTDLQHAARLAPQDPMVFHNLGVLFQSIRRDDAALAHFEHAIRLDPTAVDSLFQLAETHRQRGNYLAAVPLLDRAQALAPGRLDIAWSACWAHMHACDWTNLGARQEGLLAMALGAGEPISPFMIVALGRSPLETLLWARAWSERRLPMNCPPLITTTPVDRVPGQPIRLGYLSSDFRDHAVARLIVEVLRLHDRKRFEIFGYSIGRSDGTVAEQDIQTALDHLIPLTALDDREAARRIAADGIDILIDLNGFTADSRTAILAHRPAPIQVNFLGYPGSMGTSHVDYIIADRVVAPEDHAPFFDEKIVRLPHSYQPNNSRRPGADPALSRARVGLPATGFVFCCFNNPYKVTPALFAIWIRLLCAVPGSVLWLLDGNDAVAAHLRAAAQENGVDPGRLIFAAKMRYEDHLGRFGLADLFLDTLPYNAHTTASEALWCGVPVLTCLGDTFAGRVAASLLVSIGLPELVTTDLGAYEAMAIGLAQDPALFSALKAKLAAHRLSAPLFDTSRFVHNYETALSRMVERHASGQMPEGFDVVEGDAR